MLNFTIGPVMSEKSVIEIANCSTPYFRTEEFSSIMKENEKIMLDFLNAPENSRCVFLTASGTGGMESAIINVLNENDKVIVVNGGTFGQRFVDLCKLHGINHTEIILEFGKSLYEYHLEKLDDSYTALLINMHETSSGVLYDMKMVAEFCKKRGIMLIVDAISSFIADDLDMNDLNASVVITSSQKALALQPGIVAIALSSDAQKRVCANKEKCLYLSLKQALINGERGQTPFTPAVTIMLQLNKRLNNIIKNGGIDEERKSIEQNANYIRKELRSFPFEIVADSPSNAVTAFYTKTNAKDIVNIMKNEFNIWICPNGGEYAERVFRIGHIGNISAKDNRNLIDSFYSIKNRGLL